MDTSLIRVVRKVYVHTYRIVRISSDNWESTNYETRKICADTSSVGSFFLIISTCLPLNPAIIPRLSFAIKPPSDGSVRSRVRHLGRTRGVAIRNPQLQFKIQPIIMLVCSIYLKPGRCENVYPQLQPSEAYAVHNPLVGRLVTCSVMCALLFDHQRWPVTTTTLSRSNSNGIAQLGSEFLTSF